MKIYPQIQAVLVLRWNEDTKWTKDGYWVRYNPFYAEMFPARHPLTGEVMK